MAKIDEANFQSAIVGGCALLPLCVLLFDILLHPWRIAASSALQLEAARLLLNGHRLYVDFFVCTPPLAIYLACLPAYLSKLFNQNVCQIYSLSMWLLSVSAVSTVFLLLKAEQGKSSLRCFGVLVISMSLLGLLAGNDFGTDEYLLTILTLPYLIARSVRLAHLKINAILSVWAGMWAGLGFGLQWQFCLLLLLIELFVLVVRPGKRNYLKAPEFISVLITCIGANLLIASLSPQAKCNYFALIEPLNRGLTEFAQPAYYFQKVAPERIDVLYSLLLLIPVSIALFRKRTVIVSLSIFALTGLALFINAGDGYSRHLLPTISAGLMISAVAAEIVLARCTHFLFKRVQFNFNHLGCLCFSVAAVVLFYASYDLRFYLHDDKTGQARFDDRGAFSEGIQRFAKPQDEILFLTGELQPAYPLTVQLDLRPGSRWLYTPAIRLIDFVDAYDLDDTRIGWSDTENPESRLFFEHLMKIRSEVLDMLSQDLERRHPRFVVAEDAVLKKLARFGIAGNIDAHYKSVASFDWHNFREFDHRERLELLGLPNELKLYELKQ